MADTQDPPAEGQPPKDDDLEGRLRRLLPGILDDLLGKREHPAEKPSPAATTARAREESLREQVAAAVRELEEEAHHKREHEELRSTAAKPAPPQPETTPWRQRFWGGS